jgi:antitoxin component of RelBE/YafQ-DinJ toxin-antitoxin module
MTRNTRINARCTTAEKELLVRIANTMQRTPSDALRILVSEKAQALELPAPNTEIPQLPLWVEEAEIE